MSCEECHNKFKSLSEAYNSCGGSLGQEAGLVKTMLTRAGTTRATETTNKIQEAIQDVRDGYLGVLFLMNLDHTSFNGLLTEMANEYLL